MDVKPEYGAVGSFFSDKAVYTVPIYQRGYAWEKQEIDDFLKDLQSLYNARKKGKPKTHFLGSIITVEHQLEGVIGKHSHELVDGQQRMTTFVLLACAICEELKKIILLAQTQSDSINEGIAKDRLDELKIRFVEFKKEVHRVPSIQKVLTLSKSDNNFFMDILHEKKLDSSQRESHKRLQNAYLSITQRVELLTKETDIASYLDNLEVLVQNIDGDFALLRIVTRNQPEAVSMFQVLNDRGKGLTEGELLRSKALEMLEPYPSEQASVEQYWDDILKDKNVHTEDFLRWVYAAYKGRRPGTNTLFNDFLLQFYPESDTLPITSQQAIDVYLTTQRLKNKIDILRKLKMGDWLFQYRDPIKEWHRNRLKLLAVELGNTNSMPLLLASAELDHVKFAEIVRMVECMMFRYTHICGQHHSFLTDIYETEAHKIIQNPSGYDLNDLKTKLQTLLNNKADDRNFKVALDTLTYKKNGVSNKPLKYFLKTLEDYWRWYHEDGAVGVPVFKDTANWCRFEDATLEHIYPENALGENYDANADELKHTIGNLTLLSGLDNSTIGNQSFTEKRDVFKKVGIFMTRDVAEETIWDKSKITDRTEKLKNMAIKIFKIR